MSVPIVKKVYTNHGFEIFKQLTFEKMYFNLTSDSDVFRNLLVKKLRYRVHSEYIKKKLKTCFVAVDLISELLIIKYKLKKIKKFCVREVIFYMRLFDLFIGATSKQRKIKSLN